MLLTYKYFLIVISSNNIEKNNIAGRTKISNEKDVENLQQAAIILSIESSINSYSFFLNMSTTTINKISIIFKKQLQNMIF